MKLSNLVVPLALFAATQAFAAESDIIAVGRLWHGLQIAGPDALGRYALRVDITDLDPASPAGWAMMTHRVAIGTSLLCDAAAPQAYAGFYDQQSRQCRAESDAEAFAQMTRARDLARGGERVARLELRR